MKLINKSADYKEFPKIKSENSPKLSQQAGSLRHWRQVFSFTNTKREALLFQHFSSVFPIHCRNTQLNFVCGIYSKGGGMQPWDRIVCRNFWNRQYVRWILGYLQFVEAACGSARVAIFVLLFATFDSVSHRTRQNFVTSTEISLNWPL